MIGGVGTLANKVFSNFLRFRSIVLSITSGLEDLRLLVVLEFVIFDRLVCVCSEESFEENCFGPVDTSGFGANLLLLLGAKFGLDAIGAALLAGLVVSRELEMVFSGINLEPVAFSLGIPPANSPPSARGGAPELAPKEAPPELGPLPPPLEAEDAEPVFGLSVEQEKRKQSMNQ